VRPIGAGNYSEFSKQGSASNWDNLDDTTLDSDSTYNYSNTVGQRDTLDCGNLPAITGGIFGVQVNMAARKDDAGGRTLRSLTRVSSTDYEGDPRTSAPITGFIARSSSKTPTPPPRGRKARSTPLSSATRFRHNDKLYPSASGVHTRRRRSVARGKNHGPRRLRHGRERIFRAGRAAFHRQLRKLSPRRLRCAAFALRVGTAGGGS
jgi:hypothetical protein